MTIPAARLLLILGAVPLFLMVIVAGLIAGPVIAVVWCLDEAKRAWKA